MIEPLSFLRNFRISLAIKKRENAIAYMRLYCTEQVKLDRKGHMSIPVESVFDRRKEKKSEWRKGHHFSTHVYLVFSG
jgi:hypothetical protein